MIDKDAQGVGENRGWEEREREKGSHKTHSGRYHYANFRSANYSYIGH